MKLSTKIGIAAIVICLIALGIWGFPILHNRYVGSDDANVQTQQDANKEETTENKDGDEDSGQMPEQEVTEEDTEGLNTEDDSFLEISKQDCDSHCKEYTETEDLDYCKQVCGLSAVSEKADGCDALEDLEKDYCLKDLGISKKDLKICDQIEDNGVKKACKNRVTEDILESSSGEPAL